MVNVFVAFLFAVGVVLIGWPKEGDDCQVSIVEELKIIWMRRVGTWAIIISVIVLMVYN